MYAHRIHCRSAQVKTLRALLYSHLQWLDPHCLYWQGPGNCWPIDSKTCFCDCRVCKQKLWNFVPQCPTHTQHIMIIRFDCIRNTWRKYWLAVVNSDFCRLVCLVESCRTLKLQKPTIPMKSELLDCKKCWEGQRKYNIFSVSMCMLFWPYMFSGISINWIEYMV